MVRLTKTKFTVFSKVLTPSGAKKRKFDALSRSNEIDSYSAANSSHPPCVAQGIRGLYNMGSTCFMSVIIQSLINNPFIRSYYMGDGHVTDEDHDNSCMSCALVDIFTEFYTNDTVDGFGAVEFLAKSWQCDSVSILMPRLFQIKLLTEI